MRVQPRSQSTFKAWSKPCNAGREWTLFYSTSTSSMRTYRSKSHCCHSAQVATRRFSSGFVQLALVQRHPETWYNSSSNCTATQTLLSGLFRRQTPQKYEKTRESDPSVLLNKHVLLLLSVNVNDVQQLVSFTALSTVHFLQNWLRGSDTGDSGWKSSTHRDPNPYKTGALD